MILQALFRYYEALAAQGKIDSPGWGPAKVSFALSLSDAGEVLDVIPLKTEQQRGKSAKLAPQVLQVPLPVKRTVTVIPNFLCDHSGYFLGFDDKGKPVRSLQCFTACRTHHQKILEGVDSPAARAVLAFFAAWDPARAATHPALQDSLEELKSGANLVFWYQGGYVHEDPAVRSAWQSYYDGASGSSPVGACLVTGVRGPVAVIHPDFRGVPGAQSSGAALVSFNADSAESFDHRQGENAPVSQYAAFAYGAALNHLLSDREHVQRIGDTTVVCWAEGGERAYQSLCLDALFGTSDNSADIQQEIRAKLKALAAGERVIHQEVSLDPDRHFYVLGLAPNAARLSVRFFLQDAFSPMMKHLEAHYERLEIARSSRTRWNSLPLWKLLSETINQKSTDKKPSPQMSGELLRAILTGGRYPASLLTGVTLRIRAEHEITSGRAAIIKAYYLRNEDPGCPKEVLAVNPNDEIQNIPFTLGRLFSILEAIQLAANPGINTTVKDKYFNSASTIPATIFPLLISLAQKHLRKLEPGLRVYYEKQLTPLMDIIGAAYPTRLSLPEQGSFQLGYYHQTLKRYEKKEEK